MSQTESVVRHRIIPRRNQSSSMSERHGGGGRSLAKPYEASGFATRARAHATDPECTVPGRGGAGKIHCTCEYIL